MQYQDSKQSPKPLTDVEWERVCSLPEFREMWGIGDNESVVETVSRLYGVRFDFMSGSPGYVGPLYFVYGDAVSGTPLILVEERGELAVADV